MTPLRILRNVRFEEVDAAQIVFFVRFFNYCNDAMEEVCGKLDGGYERLILERRIGLPAVHIEADWKQPLRFGDAAVIDVTVTHIGTSSATLRYDISRSRDGAACAVIRHTVVATCLRTMTKVPIPGDLRGLLGGLLQDVPI